MYLGPRRCMSYQHFKNIIYESEFSTASSWTRKGRRGERPWQVLNHLKVEERADSITNDSRTENTIRLSYVMLSCRGGLLADKSFCGDGNHQLWMSVWGVWGWLTFFSSRSSVRRRRNARERVWLILPSRDQRKPEVEGTRDICSCELLSWTFSLTYSCASSVCRCIMNFTGEAYP